MKPCDAPHASCRCAAWLARRMEELEVLHQRLRRQLILTFRAYPTPFRR